MTTETKLPRVVFRPAEDLPRDLRRSPTVNPLASTATTYQRSLRVDVAAERPAPLVALVLVVDSATGTTRALEREFGVEAVTIDAANLEHAVPRHAQKAVQRILATLNDRPSTGSSVTAVSVDLKLSLPSWHAEPVLQFSGLRIDRARREAQTDVGPVLLTKGEFEMLAFLAENHGVAFSRPELVDGCRGGDHFLDYRAIDVQIFGLRKKLGSASWHIQTVRGYGYRFVSDPIKQTAPIRRPR